MSKTENSWPLTLYDRQRNPWARSWSNFQGLNPHWLGLVRCESCGEYVGSTATLFREDEDYDCGFAHGIGSCCVPRWEAAGYSIVGDDE